MAHKVRYWYARCTACRLDLMLGEFYRAAPEALGCPKCGAVCPVYCSSLYPLKGFTRTDMYKERGRKPDPPAPDREADHRQRGTGA